MAVTKVEKEDVKAFARQMAKESESLVNKIQYYLDSLDRRVYDECEWIDELVELQSGLDDAWRMLKGSIPD